MRSVMLVMSAVLLAGAASGCSDSIGPTSIIGTWSEDFTIAGNSRQMTLSLSGSAVSGPGTWCGEALGCGTTSVTGTVMGTSVHLVITFDMGLIETFDGNITSPSTLAGYLIDSSLGGLPQLPHAESFHRG